MMVALMSFGLTDSAAQRPLNNVESNFRNIPESQPLAVYWYWMNGFISEQGVVKDLQAMKRVGINRVQIGFIADNSLRQGPVRFLSDEWWRVLHTMFKTATELDIEVGLFNCPGWSQSGGPWVKPDESMRYLSFTTDTIVGPARVRRSLATPGKEAQDVKVLAFPLKESAARFKVTGDPATSTVFTLTNDVPVTVRSITLNLVGRRMATSAELFVERGGAFVSLGKIPVDRSNSELNVGFKPFAPVAVSLPETTGKVFRLVVGEPDVVREIRLSDIPVVERYAEKTLAKMWQTPHPMWDAYLWRSQPEYSGNGAVAVGDVRDITSCMDSDGTLDWNVPSGKWVVMRSAMLPTGVTNSPAQPEATGLEADKMSKRHIRSHFDNFIGMILRRIPAAERRTFRVVVEDSYETGGQNWTDNMIADFKSAYGYDPVPFIPVYDGVVVGSQEMSDRFLWDVRRLVADKVAYDYVGGLRQVSHEHGLTTWLENYGHWGFPGEFLQYGGQSDEISGEFWSFGDLGDIENKVASSCAHIYGKPRVWAESFTCGGPDFSQYPGQMKQRGDRFFAEGINSTLLHLYIQQPDDRVPGVNAWFGNEFNRNNTWFSQMDVFGRYLKRCNYMLQQGRYVADVAYFIGEDAPKMVGECVPAVPAGYSFDYVNAEVLMRASVKDGRLVLESGMQYEVLVLPRVETMRPALLEKLRGLVADGLCMVGMPPAKSPSLQDYPACDARVAAMADEMWQCSQRPYASESAYGKGRIYRAASLEQVFRSRGVLPDFIVDDPSLPVVFLHRTVDGHDCYFVSNQGDRHIDFRASFRVKGKKPELWNPLTAEIRMLPDYEFSTGMTEVPLSLEPYESAFVMFRIDDAGEASHGDNYPERRLLASIDGPWTVTFQGGSGGPSESVVYDSLSDWTLDKRAEIRYFSGTATYKNTFRLSRLPSGQVYIDLGKVMVMAKVRVNGRYVGGVWTAPYRLNVTGALRKGRNDIEIEVVNCWRNRLIGEKRLPDAGRLTWQLTTYLDRDAELQSSGLMGPVVVENCQYDMVEPVQ